MSIGSIASILIILGVLIFGLWKRGNLYLLLGVAMVMVYINAALTSIIVPRIQYSPVFWELAFAPVYLTTGTDLHTIVTSMFVHADLIHLMFNMFALIFIGSALEGRIGTVRLFAIFMITGIIGTLTHGVFYLGSSVMMVGASGAILGLLGALARLYPNVKFRLFFILPPMSAYLLLAIFLLIDTLLAFGNDNIAHLAHIGGAASGYLLAPLIAKVEVKRAPSKARIQGLEVLATTPELREILERVRTEDNAEVRDAWLERFYSRISCPSCHGELRIKRNSLQCKQCGWKTKMSD
jgi:membrane associated rhomboid family serine protease